MLSRLELIGYDAAHTPMGDLGPIFQERGKMSESDKAEFDRGWDLAISEAKKTIGLKQITVTILQVG